MPSLEGIKIESELTDVGKQHFAVLPDGRKFLVEDPKNFQERVSQSRDLIDKGVLGFDLLDSRAIPPESYSLAAYQTPFKDQYGRGTCFAFAGAAALEAAYKRKYGITLDLSEQYIFSMQKCTELYPDYATSNVPYENNCSFGDGQGCSDIIHHMSRFSVPEEKYAPYKTKAQMEQIRKSIPESGELSTQEQFDAFEFNFQNIPLEARLNAKYRVTGYSPMPNMSIEAMEQVISNGHEIVLDLNWGHCVLVVGYDRKKQFFLIKNSWGENDFWHTSYKDMKNQAIGGHYITYVSNPKSEPELSAMWIGKWKMDHDGWKGDLVIRRFTDLRQQDPKAATKIGNYYRDGKRNDVNGYFTDNGRGLVYYVADTTNRIKPGTLTGQRFESYIFSWDRKNAAGATSWQNIPFGVALRRGNIPGKSSKTFGINEWKGIWAMNHDGWRGTLNINTIVSKPNLGSFSVSGTYLTHDKKSLSINGSIPENRHHKMTINIPFSKDNIQRFDLLYHTWEDGVFSGVTYWGGKKFGVQGFK